MGAGRLLGLLTVIVAVVFVAAWLTGAPADDARLDTHAEHGDPLDDPARPATVVPTPSAAAARALPTHDAAAVPLELDAHGVLSAPPAPSGPQRLHVSGRLLDARGAPVAGATAYLHVSRPMAEHLGLARPHVPYSPPWDAYESTLSDAGGRFSLSAEEWADANGRRPPAARDITDRSVVAIRQPGFQVRAVPVAGTGWEVELGDIVLAPGAVLTGRVVDEHGLPLEGAEVGSFQVASAADREYTGYLLAGLLSTTSGSNGRFHATHFPAGSISLEARRTGKLPWRGEAVLHLSEPTDLGEIVLADAGLIAGRVTDEQGAPLAGADIILRPGTFPVSQAADSVLRDMRMPMSSVSGPQEQTTRTDAGGNFAFDVVHETSYTVFAHHERYEPERRRLVLPDARPLGFRLRPEGLIALTLVDDQSGAPVPGGEATLRRCSQPDESAPDDGHDPYLQTLTGRAAAARLGRDDPGIGLVVGGPAGAVRTRVEASSPEHLPLTVDLPGVAPGEVLQQTLRLQRGASIAGRVTSSDGTPLAAVDVSLARQPADHSPLFGGRVLAPERSGTTDALGGYRVGGLSADSWLVSAARSGFMLQAAIPVVVPEGASLVGIDLQLEPAGVLHGLLRDEQGLAAAGVPVQIQAMRRVEGSPTYPQRHTDVDGGFRWESLLPGEYRVSAHPGAQATVTVLAAAETRVELRLQRTPRVTGRVRDSNSAPVVAEVFAFRGASQEEWTKTDSRGEFVFEDLPTFRITFVARADGCESAPVKLDLKWSQDAVIELSFADGSLVGRVSDALTGKGVENARIEARSSGQSSFPVVLKTTSVAGGSYRFERVAPGDYALSTQHDDYVAGRSPVLSVAAGASVSHDIGLQRAGALTGTINTVGDGRLPFVTLVLTPLDDLGRLSTQRIQSQGPYRVGGIATGHYQFHVIPPESYGDAPPLLASGEVTLAAGETTTLDLVLTSH